MQRPPMSRPAAHALLHATVILWGFTAILGREISITAVPLVFYRFVVTVLGLLVLAPLLGLHLRATPRAALRYGAVGAIIGGHWLCFYGAIKYANIPTAVLTLSTMTFFTAVLEPIAFRRRAAIDELVIGAIVVLGVALLVQVELHADAAGLALGLASAFLGALFGVLNGLIVHDAPPVRLFFYEMIAGLLVVSTCFLFTPGSFVPPQALRAADIGWLVVLGVACTIVPQVWSLIVLRVLSPFTLAVTTNLEPVYALILTAILFRDEQPLSARFFGGAAVLLALVLVNGVRKATAKPKPAAKPTAGAASA